MCIYGNEFFFCKYYVFLCLSLEIVIYSYINIFQILKYSSLNNFGKILIKFTIYFVNLFAHRNDVKNYNFLMY